MKLLDKPTGALLERMSYRQLQALLLLCFGIVVWAFYEQATRAWNLFGAWGLLWPAATIATVAAIHRMRC